MNAIIESKIRHAVEQCQLHLSYEEHERLIAEIGAAVDRYDRMSDGELMAHQRGMD